MEARHHEAKEVKKYRNLAIISFSVLLLLCIILEKTLFKKIGEEIVAERIQRCSQLIEKPHDISLQKFLPNGESKELVEVLKRATMPDRTVIITIVEEAWTGPGSVLDLFLESFRIGQGTKRLLKHLLIVTPGRQGFHHCKSRHPHCLRFTTIAGVSKPATRNNLLYKVLELGYSLVFTEADVMWFRNPMPHFHNQYEVTILCDIDSKNGNKKQDRGLVYWKSNDISVEFFRYLKVTGILFPNDPFGSSFCEIVEGQQNTEMLGLRRQFLDAAKFGGFCHPIKNNSEIITMQANCCESIESKVHDLKLVLDDWRRITGRSSNNSSGQFPSWRAPDKCIQ